ncbi:hypothetical protein M3M33_13915, partial [Loigolactobacillus coryniformis]|uniref:hypothetical protein n=1 Tax=Loigolactobacillus coryniformis TaxID=1610 RepID=UPI00201A5D20
MASDDVSDVSRHQDALAVCSDAGEVCVTRVSSSLAAGASGETPLKLWNKFRHPGLCTSVRLWPLREGKLYVACGGLG